MYPIALAPTDVKHAVSQSIQDRIMRGELRPGDRLPEVELAKQYGVSRPTLREALGILHHLGVVCLEPRKGATVARVSPEDLQDVSEFRALLEDKAIRHAVTRLDDDDFRKLEQAVGVMKISADPGIIEQILAADKSFHFVIYEKSGNRMLTQALKDLTVKVQIYSFMYKKQRSTLTVTYERHKELLEAFRTRDVELAAKCTHRHIMEHSLGGGLDFFNKLKEEAAAR